MAHDLLPHKPRCAKNGLTGCSFEALQSENISKFGLKRFHGQHNCENALSWHRRHKRTGHKSSANQGGVDHQNSYACRGSSGSGEFLSPMSMMEPQVEVVKGRTPAGRLLTDWADEGEKTRQLVLDFGVTQWCHLRRTEFLVGNMIGRCTRSELR